MVKFNWDEPGGQWAYDSGEKVMLIEFKSKWVSRNQPNRRHALRERDDGSFQLIPADHEVYHDSTGVWTPDSIPHKNWNNIIMQKIAFPDPE